MSAEELARKHGVSVAAVEVLREALRRGGGRQAQFSHPDLGGMGQWSAGGMTQVGDMFNTALKGKVDALCSELAQHGADAPAAGQPAAAKPASASGTPGQDDWWPRDLGRPSASGSQNGMRYACFPDARRVVVEQAGDVTVYDSGEHRISGVAQSQGGTRELRFSSQNGSVSAADLPVAK